jgi:ABC-type lipoprotein export system ATPase subunit
MTLVTHKYTPAEMSEQELEATFAAREHTVEYLLKSLRDQIHAGTLSSFVITGPRGAGKSTLLRMVALRLRQDPELRAAWLPVVFPEEQFQVASLRDLRASSNS